MFVVSMKANKNKLALTVLLGIAAVSTVVLLLSGRAVTAVSGKGSATLAAQSNEQRVAYLKAFGWTVNEEACEIVEVAIPTEFGDVYENYNRIQEKQGFDLTLYRGKRIKRYSYEVLNYPNQPENVRANLLVYNHQIIGGDICSLKLDGFLHGFTLESKKNP